MKMEHRTDQRMLDSIGKAIAVQKIDLLSAASLSGAAYNFISCPFSCIFIQRLDQLWLQLVATVRHRRENILSGSRDRLSYPPSIV